MFGLFSSPLDEGRVHPTLTFVGRETRASSREMLEPAILAATAHLRNSGVQRGNRVGLVMETSPETVVSFFALLGLGATVVPVRGSYGLASTRRRTRSLAPAVRVARIAQLVAPGADSKGWIEAARTESRAIHIVDAPSVSPTHAPAESWSEPDPENIALLQFSSGSTAQPKGIEISIRSLVANVTGVAERVRITSTDRFVSWLPLSHDMGLSSLLCMMSKGVDLFMMSPVAFVQSPLSWLKELAKQSATLSVAPQFAIRMCLRLLDHHDAELPDDLSSLRYLMNGGEPVHRSSCREFEERLAHVGLRTDVIQPAYGLAENTCAVSVRPPLTPWEEISASRLSLSEGSQIKKPEGPEDAVSLIGNGSAIRGTEIAVFSTDGELLPEGIVGELAVRGDSLAAALVTTEGRRGFPPGSWAPTGDIGTILDGEVFLVGRSKEIIKVSGEIVAPSDIEAMLCDTLGLETGKVAAFGVEGTQDAEEVVIILESPPATRLQGDLSDEIRIHCLREFRVRLAEVLAVQTGCIRRTESGKIKRTALRETYSAGELPVLWRG